MSRSRSCGVVTALVLAASVTALVPTAGSASPAERRSGPGYHQPAAGSCYDLTAKQAAKPSSTKAPVACDAPHTLMTIKVVRLAKPVRWQSDDLFSRFYVPCQKALFKTLGGSEKLASLSAYDWWWFTPTKQERAKGARWIRCDIGLHKGSTGLYPIASRLKLSAPLPTKTLRCLVGRRLATTSCKQGHTWKAKGAFKLASLPRTAQQYLAAAQRRCPRITGSNRFAYDGPSALEWRAGNHWMVCFKPD